MGGRLPTLFPTDYCPSKVVDFNQSFSQEINIRGRPMVIFVKSSSCGVSFLSIVLRNQDQTFKNFLEILAKFLENFFLLGNASAQRDPQRRHTCSDRLNGLRVRSQVRQNQVKQIHVLIFGKERAHYKAAMTEGLLLLV